MLSFYTTCEFLSNFLCNWHEYITHQRFFVYLYQPIHWYLTRILMCLSEQRAPFSTIFASRAFHKVIWSQYSNVQVSIFVTCLNFAGTGSRLWQLYVAFVMTWYLAFKTSGRTAKASYIGQVLWKTIHSAVRRYSIQFNSIQGILYFHHIKNNN